MATFHRAEAASQEDLPFSLKADQTPPAIRLVQSLLTDETSLRATETRYADPSHAVLL